MLKIRKNTQESFVVPVDRYLEFDFHISSKKRSKTETDTNLVSRLRSPLKPRQENYSSGHL